MKINRAYQTELDPNDRQRTAFLRAAGATRWAYNWGLAKKINAIEARKTALAVGVLKDQAPKVPTAMDLHKELNLLKLVPVDQGGVPWMYESSKTAPQEALRNLDKAFQAFYAKCKSGKKGPKGFPRFKSRKKSGIGGFRLETPTVTFKTIRLPRIGTVRLKERGYLPDSKRTDVHALGVSVKERAGRWFVSLSVVQDVHDPIVTATKPILGVDVGIKNLAVSSDGQVFDNPKALAGKAKQLVRLQRSVSRKVNGSNNRRKAKAMVAKCHYKISCVRKDALHKASDSITKNASMIVIEDLNVAGMTKNHSLAKAVCDASFSELHSQIKYKATWLGVPVIVADRFYPSSKTCSSCGEIKKALTLADREFVCDGPKGCGVVIDRDLNATINLRQLAVSYTVTACGDSSSGPDRKIVVKLGSLKQEPNSKTWDAPLCLSFG